MRNKLFTICVLTKHLFDHLELPSDISKHEALTDQALLFITNHKEVEENETWRELCDEKGFSDWEEYLVAYVSKKLIEDRKLSKYWND